jgi:hypothetical protein
MVFVTRRVIDGGKFQEAFVADDVECTRNQRLSDDGVSVEW